MVEKLQGNSNKIKNPPPTYPAPMQQIFDMGCFGIVVPFESPFAIISFTLLLCSGLQLNRFLRGSD
jgi:hypothetical protein